MPAAPSPEVPSSTRTPAGRARTMGTRWVQARTVTPPWLPARWAQPTIGYLVALVGEVMGTGAGWPLSQLAPGFGLRGLFGLLVVALVALTWGAGPSVLATLAGALLLGVVWPVPATTRTPDALGSGLGLVVFGLVGLVVSLSASHTARASGGARGRHTARRPQSRRRGGDRRPQLWEPV